ncbi:ck1 family protein kinase [Stylonychia lemnae]|uniref:Casein kinase I n=1 Tax=Stylonychia lemnae TaxID=5949 RepID=A0A078A980_STYLE|nr:ck1 family protein kinase [Stylonychia lemnae]|eukprot:CDW78784.1 ck1 family protein kinase [Stylonychia lemnae]
MIKEGVVIGDEYVLLKKLGQGSQGTVWSAENTLKQVVAIKFVAFYKINNTLKTGLPRLLNHGSIGEYYYIVMSMLGSSLQDMINKNKDKFSLITVLQIGIQLVCAIENLHNSGFIHSDIKPDNILIESDDFSDVGSSLIYIVDFGISIKASEISGSNNISQETGASSTVIKRTAPIFKGNIAFSSTNQMMGRQAKRSDDMISLLYLMIYLSEGRLPWSSQRVSKNQQEAFRNQLKDPNIIDYAYYINELTKAHPKGLRSFDWVMDWTIQNENWYNSYFEKELIFKNFLKRNEINNGAKALIQQKKSLTQQNLYRPVDRQFINSNIVNSESLQKLNHDQISPLRPNLGKNQFFFGNNINSILKQQVYKPYHRLNNSQVQEISQDSQGKLKTYGRLNQQDISQLQQQLVHSRHSITASNRDLMQFFQKVNNNQQSRHKSPENQDDIGSVRSQLFQFNLGQYSRANLNIASFVLASELGDLKFSQNFIENYQNIASQCWFQNYLITDNTCIQEDDIDEDLNSIEILRNQYEKYNTESVPKTNNLKLLIGNQQI